MQAGGGKPLVEWGAGRQKGRFMFEAYPVELRPVLTRHRLRRKRHRSAASMLTGAALAFGVTASRPVPAESTARAVEAHRVLPQLAGWE